MAKYKRVRKNRNPKNFGKKNRSRDLSVVGKSKTIVKNHASRVRAQIIKSREMGLDAESLLEEVVGFMRHNSFSPAEIRHVESIMRLKDPVYDKKTWLSNFDEIVKDAFERKFGNRKGN